MGNYQDKFYLKQVDIQMTNLEYHNVVKYHQGTDFDKLNEGQDAQSGNTVDATSLTGKKDYFEMTADGQGNPNPPEVQVNSGTSVDQIKGIAEVNIIALLDIDYTNNVAFGPNGRWYDHSIDKRKKVINGGILRGYSSFHPMDH